MSGFLDRFGNLTVGEALALNRAVRQAEQELTGESGG